MIHELELREERMDQTGQYSLWQILGIWLAAGVPMWVLGWLVYPVVTRGMGIADAGLWRFRLFSLGLIWQFILSMIILYREEGNIRLATIRRRFWLNNPISPKTDERNNRLWWLLIPFALLLVALEGVVNAPLNGLWTTIFPVLAEPPGYAAQALFSPELKTQFVGDWGLLGVILVMVIFNTFLGEEFLFRGVLLPKMQGACGKWDWVANGVGFACYHLHQPWGLPGNILTGLVLAFTGKQYRTNWFPIILHSLQSLIVIFLVLGLILGLL